MCLQSTPAYQLEVGDSFRFWGLEDLMRSSATVTSIDFATQTGVAVLGYSYYSLNTWSNIPIVKREAVNMNKRYDVIKKEENE